MSNELSRWEIGSPNIQGFPGNDNRPGVSRDLSQRFASKTRKFQAPNTKFQINSNNQNSKYQTNKLIWIWKIGIWKLFGNWKLGIGISNVLLSKRWRWTAGWYSCTANRLYYSDAKARLWENYDLSLIKQPGTRKAIIHYYSTRTANRLRWLRRGASGDRENSLKGTRQKSDRTLGIRSPRCRASDSSGRSESVSGDCLSKT